MNEKNETLRELFRYEPPELTDLPMRPAYAKDTEASGGLPADKGQLDNPFA